VLAAPACVSFREIWQAALETWGIYMGHLFEAAIQAFNETNAQSTAVAIVGYLTLSVVVIYILLVAAAIAYSLRLHRFAFWLINATIWLLVRPAAWLAGEFFRTPDPQWKAWQEIRRLPSTVEAGDKAGTVAGTAQGVSIREALSDAGWPSKFLQWDERAGRLGLRNGVSGFEPFSPVQKLLHPRDFFPIERLIQVEDHICFSSVLAEDRSFFGLVEPNPTVKFPFDRFVPIVLVDQFDFWISEETSSQIWTISQIVLAAHLVEVRLNTHPRLEAERRRAEAQQRKWDEEDRRHEEMSARGLQRQQEDGKAA
jgi:hypothetical protein